MKKIIIIGAGPAGLTAAYELTKQKKEKFDVIVLEEDLSVGGISKTVRYKGNRMDIGGHRFFSKDARVVQWWNNLLPLQGKPSYDDLITGRQLDLAANGPDPQTNDKVMLKRRRVSRIYYRHKFFDYPVKMNMNTILNMGLWTTFKAGCSYLHAIMKKLPETSLENFYINRFGKRLYSMFFEGYTEKLWGRHPRVISADWGAQRVKGLSIVAIIKDIVQKLLPFKSHHVETSLIEEFSYPKFGPGQLWETAADEIIKAGGKIILGARVTKIKKNGYRITDITYEKDGREFQEKADIVISSMPIKDLIGGMNNVAQAIQNIAAGLPYRDFVTVGLLLEKLNLKNKTKLKTLNNIVPDCWIYVQDTKVKLGRIQIFNNWSPYLVQDPMKTVWIGLEYFCTEGDQHWQMTDAQWQKFAAEELVEMGIIDNLEAVKDSHVERVKKAYPAYFDTYKYINRLTDWLNKIRNLYCIGRNGQHRYNNMDHSMVTSFLCVKHILGELKDKNEIWKVNTEKDYHEKADH
ncbi:MAG: NAD(P)/FAD-dependent oxidoreductase [Alphaproteobacteria bacterium]|nr:NAD(P)/FAD-dependent oxidoreductase [Alphaproteobacteria bacterium]